MRVIFMGTPDFAVSVLAAVAEAGHEILLAVTQPDRPKGRGKQIQYSPVKEWAIEYNVPLYQPRRIRDEEAAAYLARFEADIIVVAAFGQILPKEILELPPYGCVNVHASLLPKYRGAAPIQWAVINGDPVSGVTTMQMGVGLDDGDMLLKEEVPLAADETGGSLFDKLAKAGGKLCVRTLEGLERGEITPIPQNEAEATHVGMIKKSMGEMDFSRSAIELERLVRGLNPWPSAFTHIGTKTLKIWRSAAEQKLPEGAGDAADCMREHPVPGMICHIDSAGIWVLTGDGFLILQEVQLEGKKRMSAADFLRGHDLPVGIVFKKG